MDGPAHYRKAEELADKAEEYVGQGDGQESAAVWAAVAQVHATLALAAPHDPDFGEEPRPLQPVIPPDEFQRLRQMKRNNP